MQTRHHEVPAGVPLSCYELNTVFAEAIFDCITILQTTIPQQDATNSIKLLDIGEELEAKKKMVEQFTDTTTTEANEHTSNWRHV